MITQRKEKFLNKRKNNLSFVKCKLNSKFGTIVNKNFEES